MSWIHKIKNIVVICIRPIARVLYSLMVRHLKVGEVGYPGRLGRTQLSAPKMLPKALKVKRLVNLKADCLNPVI